MWYSKILVAYDGSAASKKALDTACEMALTNPDASIIFAYVLVLGDSSYQQGATQVLVSTALEYETYLNERAALLPNPTSVVILKGNSPSELIIKCAKDNDCDVVVMGSRGMGGVKGYLGSVSRNVVQKAPATVVVTKLVEDDVEYE